MYTGLLHTHSMLRWVVLLLLVVAVFRFLAGAMSGASFGKGDARLRLFTLISTHIQVLVGLILYFVSPFVQFNSNTMSEPSTRFWTVEHLSLMIVAVVVITIGNSRSKKASGAKQHRTLAIFFGIALLLILAAIPWPWREAIGRPLLPF